MLLSASGALACGPLAPPGAAPRPMEFEPRAGIGPLTEHQYRTLADRYVGEECPRLQRAGGLAAGAAHVTLRMDPAGRVTHVRVDSASRDRALDERLGALAARLDLGSDAATVPPAQPSTLAPGQRERTAVLGYSCLRDAAVGTFELTP